MVLRSSRPLVAAAVMLVMGAAAVAQAAPPEKLPLPQEIKDAKAALGSLAKAAVPDEARNLAQDKYDRLLGVFNDHWKPLEAAYADVLAVGKQIETHNKDSRNFGPGQEAALARYNAEAEELNAKKDKCVATMETLAEDVSKWLESGEAQRFTDTATKLATGKIVFRRGLAWYQLQALAEGVDAGKVFDGR